MKEIINDFDKKWYDYDRHKTCPICHSTNIEKLTKSSWWVYYFKCNDCNKLFQYNFGDKMGGQADGIYEASMDDMNKDLEGEYGQHYKLD